MWGYTNLWFAVVAVFKADQGAGHAVAVVLVIHPGVVLEGQHTVTWPGIDKASTVWLQILQRNQVVVARNQALEGVQTLSVGSHNLTRRIIAGWWHGWSQMWYNRQVVQHIRYCAFRAHSGLVTHSVKFTSGFFQTAPNQYQLEGIYKIVFVLIARYIVVKPGQVAHFGNRNGVVFNFTSWVGQARIHIRGSGGVVGVVVGAYIFFPTQTVAHKGCTIAVYCIKWYPEGKYLHLIYPTSQDWVVGICDVGKTGLTCP